MDSNKSSFVFVRPSPYIPPRFPEKCGLNIRELSPLNSACFHIMSYAAGEQSSNISLINHSRTAPDVGNAPRHTLVSISGPQYENISASRFSVPAFTNPCSIKPRWSYVPVISPIIPESGIPAPAPYIPQSQS